MKYKFIFVVYFSPFTHKINACQFETFIEFDENVRERVSKYKFEDEGRKNFH